MTSTPAGRDAALALLAEALEGEGGDGPALTARQMFGEWGLYADGLFFALVCDDRLFLKPTPAGRAVMNEPAEGRPFPGAKPWLMPGPADLDDPGRLARVVRETLGGLS